MLNMAQPVPLKNVYIKINCMAEFKKNTRIVLFQSIPLLFKIYKLFSYIFCKLRGIQITLVIFQSSNDRLSPTNHD